MSVKTTIALALAGGSLAIGVPAAVAAGGGEDGAQSAPVIQDEGQQDRARPDRGDCPEKDGGAQQESSTEAPSV